MSASTIVHPDAAAPPPPPAPVAAATDHMPPLRWDGGVARLVAIGLGNTAMAVATLGVYRFWGKARLRRHLWAHQELLGTRLEYAGTGGELLRGFLRALLVFLPALLLVALLDALLKPFGVAAWAYVGGKLAFLAFLFGMAGHAARRTIASRTLWRGLRFRVVGPPWRYGCVSAGWTVASFVTLGIAHPFSVAAKARWTFDRLRLGTEPFLFDGRGRSLVWPWVLASVSALFSWTLLWALLGAPAARALEPHLPPGIARALLTIAAAAACAAPTALVAWSAWTALVMRWTARHTVFAGARFSMPGATLWPVYRLVAGNLLVSAGSLGLLHPVAQARNAAFRARHLRLDRAPDLAAVRQAPQGPGTGEGAADLFGAGAF